MRSTRREFAGGADEPCGKAPGAGGIARTAPSGSRLFAPDELAVLEAERDFLLASLDDLDAAYTAADIDEGDFQRLHDDYTARVAAVVRTLEDGRDRRPSPPRSSWRRRLTIGLAVSAFAVGAALAVNASMGERLPGQTVSGNNQILTDQQALERSVRARPDDPAARRALAQARLDSGDLVGALKEFDAAARLDPGDAASRAYGGWIVYQAGLLDEAMRRLDGAVAADPAYPDAHLFRGIALLRTKNDPVTATAELERYLAAVPAGPLDRQVRDLLTEARNQTAPTPPGR